MKSLSIQKLSDGESDIYIAIKCVFILEIIIQSQKHWCETQWNLEIKVYIDVFW